MKVKDLFNACENYFSFILLVDNTDKNKVIEEYHDDSDMFYDNYSNNNVDKFIIYDSNNAGDTGAVLEISLK